MGGRTSAVQGNHRDPWRLEPKLWNREPFSKPRCSRRREEAEASKPRSAGVRTRSGFKHRAIPNHFSPVPSSWPLRLGTAALRRRALHAPRACMEMPRMGGRGNEADVHAAHHRYAQAYGRAVGNVLDLDSHGDVAGHCRITDRGTPLADGEQWRHPRHSPCHQWNKSRDNRPLATAINSFAHAATGTGIFRQCLDLPDNPGHDFRRESFQFFAG